MVIYNNKGRGCAHMEDIVNINKIPSPDEAEKIIGALVRNGQITWTEHCKKRMEEREITMPQIINCLLKGKVTKPPLSGK